MRSLHAIADRTQQVAAPSASFRISVANLPDRSQDPFPRGSQKGERKRNQNQPRFREIEARGIRRNRKYRMIDVLSITRLSGIARAINEDVKVI